MKNILKILNQEFLGKEVTVYNLDATCQELAQQYNFRFNDILDSENWNCIKEGAFTFIEKFDEFGQWEMGIDFEFEIVKDNEDEREIIIKITDINLI